MSRLAPLLVAIPLGGAALAMLAARHRAVQRWLTIGCTSAGLGLAVALLVHVERSGSAAVAHVGAWGSAIGITYVVDRLAGVMLVIGYATLLLVACFAVGQKAEDESATAYHPAYLILTAGVAAAFCAGDLFHLFVAFEVLLISSYVLLTLHGRPGQIRSGTTYVVINTVESIVLVVGVGLVYAATGTLSMADLPDALAALDNGVRTGLQMLLLIAFGLKAAVFPLFSWLPDSYPTAPSPVTAVFAGLLTKVGVYCLIRTQTLLFPGEHDGLLLWVAGFTMVIGVLGAVAQSDMKRILSFHIVSQIGYMVMGLAIGGPVALAATVFFVIHQIPIKTSLFLVGGIVEHSYGTGDLDRLGGLARRSGFLALCFALPALSLAGLPPLSGFVGKLGLVDAGFGAGAYAVTGVALAVSLLTLVSMSKIWLGAFWGEPVESAAEDPGTSGDAPGIGRRHPLMVGATATMVAAGLTLAVAAGPIYRFCERTGTDLTTPGRYAAQVEGS